MMRVALLTCFIGICFAWVGICPAQQVDVDISTVHQTMDGVAGNAYGFITNKTTWNPMVLDMILNDLTVTHVRFRSAINQWEPNNDNNDPDVINWSAFKDWKSVTQDFTLVKRLSEAGVEPILGIWEVPDWMVTNPSAKQNRIIPPNLYPEFAELIVTYILYAKQNYNADINIIGIQNEPNIGIANYFSPTELADAAEVVFQYLDKYGLSHIKLHVGDVNEPSCAVKYMTPSLTRPSLQGRIMAASYHTWHNMNPSILNDVKNAAASFQTQTWATEVGTSPLNSSTMHWALYCMKNHHYAFKHANSSLSFQWCLAGAETSIDKYGNPYPIYHALKHYHRHIVPGAFRADTSMDTSSLYTTAFINKPAKKLSIVTINTDSYGKTATYNLIAPTVEYQDPKVFKTTSSSNYKNMGAVSFKQDWRFDYHLDKESFHTFECAYNNLVDVTSTKKPSALDPQKWDYIFTLKDADGIKSDINTAGVLFLLGKGSAYFMTYDIPNPPPWFESAIDASGEKLTMKLIGIPPNSGIIAICGGVDKENSMSLEIEIL